MKAGLSVGRTFGLAMRGRPDDVIRLDGEQARERLSLIGRETGTILVRINEILLLVRRQVAEFPKCLSNLMTTLRRKAAELVHRIANLLTLLRCKLSDGFVSLEPAASAIGVHVIELRKPVPHPLLGLGRKIVKSRLSLQGPLLLIRREIAVPVHPLEKMFLIPSRVVKGRVSGMGHHVRSSGFMRIGLRLLGRARKAADSHQQSRKHCRAGTADFEEQSHRTRITAGRQLSFDLKSLLGLLLPERGRTG